MMRALFRLAALAASSAARAQGMIVGCFVLFGAASIVGGIQSAAAIS